MFGCRLPNILVWLRPFWPLHAPLQQDTVRHRRGSDEFHKWRMHLDHGNTCVEVILCEHRSIGDGEDTTHQHASRLPRAEVQFAVDISQVVSRGLNGAVEGDTLTVGVAQLDRVP